MRFFKRHTANTENRVYNGFPEAIRSDVDAVLKVLGVSSHEPHQDERDVVLASGEFVKLPSRVYFTDVDRAEPDSLTQQQRAVLASLMTRHHSGYQREYWTRKLCMKPYYWAAPYLAAIHGDYVFQILRVLGTEVVDEWIPLVSEYSALNRGNVETISNQIISYWQENYRWYPPNIRELRDYPPYQSAVRLDLWYEGVGRRFLKQNA